MGDHADATGVDGVIVENRAEKDILDRSAMDEDEESNDEEGEEEEEEEGDVCRICRNSGDSENPLRYPCACSGSIKYVHQDCLLQWLNHSNSRQCEVCKHAFSFSPVYAADAPARLPFEEFLVGIAMKACHVLQFIFRLAFVLCVWLLIIPSITYWIWRLTFVRSLGEAHRLFISHITAQLIFMDCLHGFLLSVLIVFIFLGATSIRDYIRNLREIGGHDADRDDALLERNGGRAARRLGDNANRAPLGDGNGEEAGEVPAIANAGQIIRRNAEQVAAGLERLEAQVEQMLDGLDDADGAEDVPFDELVGMQGPVFHLVENAITVLASNAIFLAVVIFLPFSLGRIVLFYLSWFFSSKSSPMLVNFMPLTESALSFANIAFNNALSVVKNWSTEIHNEGVMGHMVEMVDASLKINATTLNIARGFANGAYLLKEAINGSSYLSDVTTLAVGYVFICCLVLLYLGSVSAIRYARGEPWSVGRLHGLASIVDAIPSLCRQVFVAFRHVMTMVKVSFLLVIELGVFPLMCGWWLDICTLKMFKSTIAQRVEFFSMSPFTSTSIHWLVGITYMLQISIFVSLLRGVLRNGVLYFLRDPADPNYNPFRDLIDDPIHKHARRVLLSIIVYGSLIVILVFLPVKLAMRLVPSIFPLDIVVSDPFMEIPVHAILFQVCIPFAMKHFKPRASIKALLHNWFSVVGSALGLTEFLLPRQEDSGGLENRNGRAQIIEGLHGGRLQQHLLPHIFAGDHDRRGVGFENPDNSDESDMEDQADSEYGFVLRIVLLLVLAWMTLLLLNASMIVIPISIGRAAFNSIPHLPITHGMKCNDLFSFSIGSFILWCIAAGTKYAFHDIQTWRVRDLVPQVYKWCSIVLKSALLLAIWIFVIPVLIGLLVELLVLVPLRVPIDESPVFLLYHDWVVGLIFLKIWTRLVMLHRMAPLFDVTWHAKFERMLQDGFSRLHALWVLNEIIMPIVTKLLTALCLPYVFAKGIFPVFGYPLIVNSAVYRYAWIGFVIISVLCVCAERFPVWFMKLHDSIRDDRYLIGRRLHNFGEAAVRNAESRGAANVPSSPVDMDLVR